MAGLHHCYKLSPFVVYGGGGDMGYAYQGFVETCENGYFTVFSSDDELAQYVVENATPSVDIFHMPAEDGALIAAAISAVWAIAWGMRQLGRALDAGGGHPSE